MSGKSDLQADVLIVGGGLVGLPLALALGRSGLSSVVVDAQDPDTVLEARFDGRVSAITHASWRMLERLGIAAYLDGQCQPLCDIVVSDGRLRHGASSLFLHFDHHEIGDAPLGYMVENRHIRAALQNQLTATPEVTLVAPVGMADIRFEAAGVVGSLLGGREVRARLCLAADGRGSQVRAMAGIKTVGWDYRQAGIVCTVEHELPHEGVAHEYFLPPGPFAILPMTGQRSSLVWTEHERDVPALLALDEAAFAAEMSARFGDHLGVCRPVGPRWSYPLSLQLARDYVRPRAALVGDAAHVVHPLAGQGLNLGLRDVAALAEVLVDAHRLGLDIGALDVLERYQAWRRFDTVTLAAGMDVLNRLFSNDIGPVRLARDLGLGLVNRIGPARRFFMRYARGDMGAAPRLLRGEPL